MSIADTYHQIKQQYPDYILLFQIGDFYETFDKDAETAAEVCDLVLTTRILGDHRVKLAGVPYHSVEPYIAKLVNAGYKVALAHREPGAPRDTLERRVRHVVVPE